MVTGETSTDEGTGGRRQGTEEPFSCPPSPVPRPLLDLLQLPVQMRQRGPQLLAAPVALRLGELALDAAAGELDRLTVLPPLHGLAIFRFLTLPRRALDFRILPL